TGLIAWDLAALVTEPAPRPGVVVAAVLAAAGLWDAGQARVGRASAGQASVGRIAAGQDMTGFTLWGGLRRSIALGHGGADLDAVLICDGPDRAQVEIAGHLHHAQRHAADWWIDGARGPARVVCVSDRLHVFDRGCHSFTRRDLLARAAGAGETGNLTVSPMPGLVKAVFVVPGQAVAAGDRLAVLEAMKMEHTLTAARDGVVAEVLAFAGVQVEAGAALIVLEPVIQDRQP
ncbi:MAG: biotin/lipoyl-containing protein, partial [Paracoccaceae bacterium]|nr:biotin/lipoyl-containing protein [Paracoccaceae bacterium]